MPREQSATGHNLREGDTILVEAVVAFESSEYVSLRVGSRYGQAASVKPEQVHTILRRHFSPGEQVMFDNGMEVDDEVYTVVAISGEFAWITGKDEMPETRSTTMLRPIPKPEPAPRAEEPFGEVALPEPPCDGEVPC